MALINSAEVDFKNSSDVVAPTPIQSKKRRLALPSFDDDKDFVVEQTSEDDRSARVFMTASKILMPALRSVLNDNKTLWDKDLENKEQVENIIIPCSRACMTTLSQVNDLKKELELLGLDVVNVKDQWPLRRLIQYVALLNEKQKDKYGETSSELTLAVFKPIFESYNKQEVKQTIDRFGGYRVKYDSDLMLLNKIIGTISNISCIVEGDDWVTNRGHCITDLVSNLVKTSCESLKKQKTSKLSKDVQRQLICRTLNDAQSLQIQSYEYEKSKSIGNVLPVFPANALADKLIKYTGLFRGVQSKLVNLVYSILAKGNEYVVNVEENNEWSKRMNFIDVLYPVIETVMTDKNITIEDKQIALERSILLSSELYDDVLSASKLDAVDSDTSKQLLDFSINVLCNTVRSNVSSLEAPKVYLNYLSALAGDVEIQKTITDVSLNRGVSREIISATLIKSMFPLMSEVSKFNYFEANRPDVICSYATLALKHLKDGRVLSQLSNNIASHAQDDIGIIEKELSTPLSYYCVVRQQAFNDIKDKFNSVDHKDRIAIVQDLKVTAEKVRENGGKTKAMELVGLSERFFISRLPLFSTAIRQLTTQLSEELNIELAFMSEKNKVKGMP
jgi:hypothetical protein